MQIYIKDNSMYPLIHKGDTLKIVSIPFDKLRTDDVICYKYNQQIQVHRIIYKSKNQLITKGDNETTANINITVNKILGKVIKIKRRETYFQLNDVYLTQSIVYLQEIIKLQQIFTGQNIKYLILKGLPLHLYYEQNNPERIYSDCDLLIDRKKYFLIRNIFINNGYKDYDSSLINKNFLPRYERTILYIKHIHNVEVRFDIHFEPLFLMNQLDSQNLLYSSRLLSDITEDFLETKRLINIEKKGVFIPAPHNLIMYLSLHFFHHGFMGAARLELIHKIIVIEQQKNKELWSLLKKQIKKYKFENFSYLTFALLKKFFNTPVPNDFFKSIKPGNPVLFYYSCIMNSRSVFNALSRTNEGILRFVDILFLSPVSMLKKLQIFANIRTWSYVFMTIYKLIFK